MPRLKKRLPLALALLWVLCLPAGAEVVANSATDTTYSGALDSRTGLPAADAQEQAAQGGVYPLREGEYGYEPETGRYVCYVGGQSFTSSVPPGILLPQGRTASFTLPAGLTGTLYRNGDPVAESGLTAISQPGRYILQVQGSGAFDSFQFEFAILDGLTNALADYTLPDGFVFDSVLVNGEALTPEYSNYMEFLEEGEYQLSASCPDIGQSFSLSFTLDRTAPTLALPEVTDGEAGGPVTLADLEPDAWVAVERDGESSRVTSPETVLAEAGRYVLTVYDQAGNSSRYEFTIHNYLNLSAVTAIGLAALGAGGVVFYSRWVRKHARVG